MFWRFAADFVIDFFWREKHLLVLISSADGHRTPTPFAFVLVFLEFWSNLPWTASSRVCSTWIGVRHVCTRMHDQHRCILLCTSHSPFPFHRCWAVYQVGCSRSDQQKSLLQETNHLFFKGPGLLFDYLFNWSRSWSVPLFSILICCTQHSMS